MRGTKKFVDVTFAIADMNASSQIIEKCCGLLQVFQPSDALLLLNRYPRLVDFFLKRRQPLEFLAGPELGGGKTKRQPLTRDCKTRMHQDAANSVRPEASGLVAAAIHTLRYPDGFRRLSFINEFRRIMEHENQAVSGSYALAGRLKMSAQNIGLADPVVGEKAIGRLRVGPILADQRNALPHRTSHPRDQLAEPPFQPLVHKVTSRNLLVKPCVLVHRIRPRIGAEQRITRDSRRAIGLPSGGYDLWVIESRPWACSGADDSWSIC
jgi:hypothetical protein